MRKLAYGASIVLIGCALVFVPLPVFVVKPTPAIPVSEAVTVSGGTDQVSGRLLLTTVAVGPATTVDGIMALLDRHEDVTRRQEFLPPEVSEQEFFELQRKLFEESIQVAASVGLRLAGQRVQMSGQGARVIDVVPGAPAAGRLQPGDVVVAATGQPIRLASELAYLTTRAQPGDRLTLTVRRDGHTVMVPVAVGRIPGRNQVGLGIGVETVNQTLHLPRGVAVKDRSSIGGPSAGLMIALHVYDLFDGSDLTRQRAIAGTGTVTLDGRVGPIGGIAEKVLGAQLTGADIFLTPASQVAAARAVAPSDLQIVPVDTVEQAVRVLRR